MICPHCGNEINNAEPIYVNLANNNGCNPAPIVTVIPNAAGANALNPSGQLWTNTVCAAAAPPPTFTTFIKF